MIDKKLLDLEAAETKRLNDDIELIASENYPSQDILDLMGSHLSCKYSEGFCGHRHYAGCEVIDKLENYAIQKACELFKCNYANVQPWSGSQANLAVYAGLLNPLDKVLGMSLSSGGHLTHFSKASDSSKEYTAYCYGLDENGYLNYDEIEKKLYLYHPRLLVVGASAYSRVIDFERIRKIVDKYNDTIKQNYINNPPEYRDYSIPLEQDWQSLKCYFMVDMAHIAGLVAAGLHPSPIPYADVVTSTTHKTLRGPRGGLILWNDASLCNKLNSGVFPKTQGGANQATIAAKAQCFIEANTVEFKKYAKQILLNMQALIKGIKTADKDNLFSFVSGGSDNHLVLLNIKKLGITGKEAEDRLTQYKIITNKNMINDDKKPSECTGLRLGTAAITTRGFTEDMCYELGRLITDILTYDTNIDDTVTDVIDFDTERFTRKVQELLDKVGPFYTTKSNVNSNNSPNNIA